jgi:hypothetical protein
MNSINEQKVESIRLAATTWTEFPEVGEVRPIGDDDYAILSEIRDVLIKHNAINRFGINLIHRHFDLNQDEVIFETTDVPKRPQHMEVRPASEMADYENVLETQWVFDTTRSVVCVGYCDYNRGHKHYHSKK